MALNLQQAKAIYDHAVSKQPCLENVTKAKQFLDSGDLNSFEQICRANHLWLKQKNNPYFAEGLYTGGLCLCFGINVHAAYYKDDTNTIVGTYCVYDTKGFMVRTTEYKNGIESKSTYYENNRISGGCKWSVNKQGNYVATTFVKVLLDIQPQQPSVEWECYGN